MNTLDLSRQRYLDLIHRCLQRRLDYRTFQLRFTRQLADEREYHWRHAWKETRTQRCLEREHLTKGESPLALPDDPRRFPRMLDRIGNLCLGWEEEDLFRARTEELLIAYQSPGSGASEARYVDCPPYIRVFERPLPPGSDHHYPCAIEDLRRQLARVPEYDLEGLWAIGLAPADRSHRYHYATCFRWKWRIGKPVIEIYSTKGASQFMLRGRIDSGSIQRRLRVELRFGLEVERCGSYVLCRWPAEAERRYIIEHVLLHEIGHHVLDQQRWRARLRYHFPDHAHEQFADDYALRLHRELNSE